MQAYRLPLPIPNIGSAISGNSRTQITLLRNGKMRMIYFWIPKYKIIVIFI